MDALKEIAEWTPGVHRQVIRSTGENDAEHLRGQWHRGEVAAFTNDKGAVVVVEIVATNDTGERWGLFHACEGRGVPQIVANVVAVASAAGVEHFMCEATTKAHARLYGRYCRKMQERGGIQKWAVHPPTKQPTSPTSAKTIFSAIPAYRVTLSTLAKPVGT